MKCRKIDNFRFKEFNFQGRMIGKELCHDIQWMIPKNSQISKF